MSRQREWRLAVVILFGGLLFSVATGSPAAAAAAPQNVFVDVPPCRIVDTRRSAGPFGGPALAAGAPRSFALSAGPCPGIPSGVSAYSLNVTATNTRGPGFFLVYPEGGSQPLVSTLNYVGGQTVANAAIVPAGSGAGVTVVGGVSGADLIIDVAGYFVPGSSALSLPFTGSGADPVAAFSVTNTGGGVGVQALSTGGGIPGAALNAHGTGIGAVITNSSSDTALLLGNNVAGGTGYLVKAFVPAGEFHVDGQGNLSTPGSVTADTAGVGPALRGTASLFGVEGHSGGSGGSGVIGVGDADAQGVAGRSSSGNGVNGISTSGDGVQGTSATRNGVEGHSGGNGASGVYGQNTNPGGYGVYGRNLGGGYGIGTDGPAFQTQSQGGWVKAMALIDPSAGSPIVRCFNSQQPASTSSQSPCGMTYAKEGTGSYFVDFGFKVDNRFLLIQPALGSGAPFFSPHFLYVGSTGIQAVFLILTPTQFTAADTPFFVFVF